MTKVIATPTLHPVYNYFDRFGLLLGLPRLRNETNSDYKRRLFDVLVNRADSTYQGLINGITRELGLKIIEAMTIRPIVDANGDPLLTQPAIVFLDTKCTIYSNYITGDILTELDRWEITGNAWTLGDLRDAINNTGYFVCTLEPEAEENQRSMTIYNQKSLNTVASEDISGAGVVISLANNNLIKGTVSVRSPNLLRQVTSQEAIRLTGDYYVDLKNGLIFAGGAPAEGSFIRYQYRNDIFVVKSSPVIIHNLQSDDFKTKMFDQLLDPDGNMSSGLPTGLGADIINELLSVSPSLWGE